MLPLTFSLFHPDFTEKTRGILTEHFLDLLFTADIENDWTLHELAGNDEEGGGWTEAPGVFRNVLNQVLKGQFREMFFNSSSCKHYRITKNENVDMLNVYLTKNIIANPSPPCGGDRG